MVAVAGALRLRGVVRLWPMLRKTRRTTGKRKTWARSTAAPRGIGFVLTAFWAIAGLAQEGPALPEDSLTMERMFDGIRDGSVTLDSLRRRGMEVFTTPFNSFDGYGDGPYVGEFPSSDFGHRPTLQGNGMTLRVNGLDAQSCNECHSFVKQSARPRCSASAAWAGSCRTRSSCRA